MHSEPAAHAGSAADSSGNGGQPNGTAVVQKSAPIGSPLYAGAAPVPRPAVSHREPERRAVALDPILIANSRLTLIRKQEIPSQRDGVMAFVGIEVKPGEVVAEEDKLPPVRVNAEMRQFRRLKEGDRVEAGQLLARVDDTLPVADEAIKVAKLAAAEAESKAADKTRDETLELYRTQQKLFGSGTRAATSEEEMRRAYLTWIRYVYEAVGKAESIKVAVQELNQAKKTVEMYEIRSKIPGDVKTIYKKDGEAVKSLEPVIQIHNYDRLRVEGMIGAQYFDDLRRALEVVIEPTVRENPEQTFTGHRLDVTGVAVTNDPANPLIVSASEDGTVRVWDRKFREERRVIRHKAPVRALACTPPGRKGSLCLTGDAEGRGQIWDLAKSSDEPLELKAQHRGAIRCVAFSPYSDTCATGGDDGQVMLWNSVTGQLLYSIPGHRSAVTAVHFMPKSQLVTVSRDNTGRLWTLGSEGAREEKSIKRPSTDVTHLGVSPDGKQVLDEQGNEMRILSIPEGTTVGVFKNPSQASKFRSFALFSPDGQLVLTTSGTEGTLQLWRIGQIRSYELRQLLSGERAASSCAAFAPDGSFVVGGIKDRVYVWPMPSKEEVEQQIRAKIINVERIVETSESQIRVIAEFANPPAPARPLLPGDTVNMVAYPKK
jgi:WD40 repeat protein